MFSKTFSGLRIGVDCAGGSEVVLRVLRERLNGLIDIVVSSEGRTVLVLRTERGVVLRTGSSAFDLISNSPFVENLSTSVLIVL